MANIAEAWAGLVTNLPSIVELLEAGTRPVENRIAELADDYIQSVCPAYSAAVSACGVVPGCTDKLVDIRNQVVFGICDVCGITDVIDAIVSAWNQIPAGIRHAVVDGVEAIDSLLHGDLLGAINHAGEFIGAVGAYAIDLVRDGFVYISAGAEWAAKQLWLVAANSIQLAGVTTEIGVRTALNTLADIAHADPIGLINDAYAGIVDTFNTVKCAFFDCSNAQPYEQQFDWQFAPFILPTTYYTSVHMDPGRAEYFYDNILFNFGAKVATGFGGFGTAGTDASIRQIGAFGSLQQKGTLPYQPGASHAHILHMMPENMPGITDATKRRITSLAAKRIIARGTNDGNLIASIVNRQPKGASDGGAAWLLGILGTTALDLIEQKGYDTGPNRELNSAIADAVSKYNITGAELSFPNRRAMFLINGKNAISY